jgi:hypothetical protein
MTRPDKICVISTPTRGRSWIEDVFEEIDKANSHKTPNGAYISGNILHSHSSSMVRERLALQSKYHNAVQEWFKPIYGPAGCRAISTTRSKQISPPP